MKNKVRIACIIPIADDPTSYYRGIGPIAALQEQSELDIQFLFPNPINWAAFKLADIIFMQRPAMPEHFAALCLAKDYNKPVWSDFDDDNLAVPKDNPTYPQYAQVGVKDAIVKIARHSDILTVSTNFLKKKYGIYNKNTFVVPNALPDEVLIHRTIPDRPRDKMAMWRGTATHHKNLRHIQKEIIETAKKHPSWKFGFMGYDPLDITENMKNHVLLGQYSITDYFKALVQIHPSLLYYVLAGNDHAQARSHISWLESSFAGAMFLGPATDEFTRPGALNFDSPEQFATQMDAILSGEVDIEKHAAESWAAVQETYMLSRVNHMREQIVRQLSGR